MPTLPLFPDSAAAPLVGIARLAAHADPLREGHHIEYFSLPARSVLGRVRSGRRLPFQWAINPYRGCEFACKYCYARYTHEFMELRDPLAFEQKIYVKQQAAWLLRQDLKKVRPNESIAIGTATDPYQPAERRYNVTRGILEELAQHRGLRLGIITKSDLILRDAGLLRQICQHNSLHVSLTVTTINIDLARILEPRAPRPDLRLEAVRKLHLAGIPAGVNCAPLLPGITDAPSDLSALVLAAKQAHATSIFAGPLFLKPCAAAVFLPFLEKEFPHLVEIYRKRYANSAFLPPDYGKRINRLLAELREKHGMTPPPHPDARFGERQTVQDSLFCAQGEDAARLDADH
jgi:DNA repair photolyase